MTVELPIEQAFWVSQTRGEVRRRWDPFIRSQHLMDGAVRPDTGVRTKTRSRHGLAMVSEYVSFRPPTQVGMVMVGGPWFFANFSGGWSFRRLGPERSEAIWRYTFRVRPSLLQPIADPIGIRLLGGDIERRIAAYAAACEDPTVVEAAQADLDDLADPHP